MKNKITPSVLDIACPLCLSQDQKPIVLKNFQRAVDVYFIKQKATLKPDTTTTFNKADQKNNVSNTNLNLSETAHFFRCENCKGIFRNPEFILPEDEEHQRYSTHENNLEDPRYVKYLLESVEPFLNYINKERKGLDYGCGPTKGLEYLLKTKGYDLESYDKYFYPNLKSTDSKESNTKVQMLNSNKEATRMLMSAKKYDYLFCHEVVEHFVNYKSELQAVLDALNPLGQLFIRTELYPEDLAEFENWYYKNDSTHVFFLSLETFKYIEENFKTKFTKLDKNKFILAKVPGSESWTQRDHDSEPGTLLGE